MLVAEVVVELVELSSSETMAANSVMGKPSVGAVLAMLRYGKAT